MRRIKNAQVHQEARTFLNSVLVHFTTEDFDALTHEARGWHVELDKLDNLPFRGDVFQWVTEEFVLSVGRFSSRVKQVGEPPPGYRTFVVPGSAGLRMFWRGREVAGNDLLVFPRGAELHAISRPAFEVLTISIPEAIFHETMETPEFQALARRCQTLEAVPCHPRGMTELRRILRRIVAGAGSPGADPVEAREEVLAGLLGVADASPGGGTQGRDDALRRRAVREAERHVLAHPLEAPTVRDLSKIAGVSKRTLEYAFAQYAGVRPKGYIRALRLNGARRILRSMRSADAPVADAANAWGFWHMGQFAADYRKLFGELPSETLKG